MKAYDTLMNQIKNNEGLVKLMDVEPDDGGGVHGGAAMFRMSGTFIAVIWSTDLDWDHVSVSHKKRTPTYQEMKRIKKFFFRKGEVAIEYHPADEEYISINDNVLHMWRPHKEAIPMPPRIMA